METNRRKSQLVLMIIQMGRNLQIYSANQVAPGIKMVLITLGTEQTIVKREFLVTIQRAIFPRAGPAHLQLLPSRGAV